MRDDKGTAYVIGIAASAGGLEAISALVQSLPHETGASYVIAQHMSPSHKSLMSTLVARETLLPVQELVEDVVPEPDTIYVTPPNKDVTYLNGKLCLSEPAGRQGTPKPSADRLFYSLADELGEKCIAIVLSGTGSDGSYGVQAVREAGGITIAQDQSTAKYDGMPASAVETGCIDLVLSPEQIAQHLKKIMAKPRDLSALQKIGEESGEHTELLQILMARTQVDFREYKGNTVQRRIQRRMVALGMSSYEQYVAHCRQSSAEIDALYKDLLISVTRFFRDPNQFERLGIELRAMIENHPQDETLRVWVAGCATGEEVYTIAILIAEAFGGLSELEPSKVQIFATDIDESALRVGRRGVYPGSAIEDIPPHLLDRYFDRDETKVSVKPALKQLILFSHHNVFQDPPFINIDLVSLRNLLIYFKPKLQERVLNRVHYALKTRGLLFLGTSETIGPMQLDYEIVSDRNRLFRKRSLARKGVASRISEFQLSAPRWLGATRTAHKPTQGGTDIHKDMFEGLARSIGSNSMLVTGAQDIIRVFGDISPFIELRESSRLDLSLSLLRSPLRDEAPSLCSVAQKRQERRRGSRHEMPGADYTHVYLEAFPIALSAESERYTLLAIHKLSIDPEIESGDSEVTDMSQLRQLEADVASTREALQQTIEELQTSNEEQQSLNEELQSTNEDLQATNEELETSNEELQSSNEELLTVNEELQINAAELEGVRRDLESVLQTAPLAILVIDNAMQISRCSEPARRMFRITEGLERMHLSQCVVPKGFPSLTQIASETFSSREPRAIQFESESSLISLKSVPYFNEARDLRGVTIVISEVDTEEMMIKMQMVEEMERIGHFRLDLENDKLHWSPEVFQIHGLTPEDGVPSLDDAIKFFHPDDRPLVQEAIETSMRTGQPYQLNLRLNRADGRMAYVEARGTAQFDIERRPLTIVGVFRDIDREITRSMRLEQFEHAQADRGIGFYSYDVANETPYWSPNLFHILGMDPDRDQASIQGAVDMFHPEDREMVSNYVARALKDGQPYSYRARLQRKDGTILPCKGSGRVRRSDSGDITHVFGLFSLIED
ncbi:PAS domain-containing protein [Pseudooceanicola sp. 216_PA32_1]|uniref:protein-glutamate O-methyltransferase n=1 Tax=Pseudooceanicola pacificus TaxID=2676438 RepID=A0A844W442_9RHOB|nr:chemotaxis protein CheB [Pseudooceanicola pacificus]MWB77581.1 PAS domain-containing protein [Pseudooceanicola pacificus]